MNKVKAEVKVRIVFSSTSTLTFEGQLKGRAWG
jgi:hypothetical protein